MQKKKKKKRSHVPIRLNILFFLVFILFSALILRLGVVQIVYGDDYKKQVERAENSVVSTPVPRGQMYDRYQRTVVDNTPLKTISYTRMKGSKSEDRLKVAQELAKYIDMPTDKITDKDKKNFWIQLHPDLAKDKISKQEVKDVQDKKITDEELYNRQLNRVTDAEVATLTPMDLKVLAIKQKMDGGYPMTPQIIKNQNVSEQEYAMVSENLDKLPGVDTTTDWKRNYPYGDMFTSVLGRVTSTDEGLPKENLDYYLVRDYNRNDRVGKSYIEQQYEDMLHGTKAETKMVTDKEGNILDQVLVSKGERGKDLILTIDMELQNQVEQIITEELLRAKPSSPYLDRAFVVMMNPKNGEVLSMGGKMLVPNASGQLDVQDYALGAMTSSYPMGSAVKGATVLTGYQTGAIQPGSTQLDEPLVIKDTQTKKSWTSTGMGEINDLTALQRSSNVYMFKTAIDIGTKFGGKPYQAGQALSIPPKALDTMRYYFSEFGLGVPTGIDLPNESAGFKSTVPSKNGILQSPGLMLDFAIGQFDTYTPLQMAQYVSTIANGGYRMKPEIVKEIREPASKPGELGKVVESMEPTVLNRIDMTDAEIKQVQQGFKMVMEPGGTGAAIGANNPYNPAGKTGTAQSVYGGPDLQKRTSGPGGTAPDVYNLTLVTYAPADNPEVAISVVVPWVSDDHNPISKNIGRRVMDAYFNLKKQEVNIEQNPTAIPDNK